jgi:hypothetical protein
MLQRQIYIFRLLCHNYAITGRTTLRISSDVTALNDPHLPPKFLARLDRSCLSDSSSQEYPFVT